MTTVLMAGYNVAVVPTMAQAFQRLYITNDFDAMRVSDDGITLRIAGIVAPTVAPVVAAAGGGAINAGTHYVRYRYQDIVRGRLSDPTAAVAITIVAGTQTLNVTPTASADAYVTGIIIEVTAAGAAAYYRIGTVANATALTGFSVTDAALIQLVAAARDGDSQHQPPPLALLACEHRGRMWLWGKTIRTFAACTVTNGSPTINGAGFSTQWAGQQVVGVDGALYIILSATAVAITLTTNYAGGNAVGTITVKSGTPGLLCWSRATFPESFDPTTFGKQITLDSGDTPAALFSYYSDLYAVGQRSMRRLFFTTDPATGQIGNLAGSMGAFHQRCVCTDCPGLAFGWGRDGMWVVSAMQPKKISMAVEQTLAALADAATAPRFVRYEPTQRLMLFFFCLTGETSCRAALAFHPESNRWELWYYRQGITSACPNSAYTDRQRLLLADATGSSWRVGANQNDGGDSGVMVATNASTTVITGTNAATVGQMCYRPSTAEAKVITAANPAQITVAAFSTATAIGEELWIGSIKQRILSQWFIGDGLDSKKRPQWLLIFVRANRTAGRLTGKVTIRFYRDFDDASPIAFSNNSGDENPLGITIVDGATYITADLDVANAGYVSVPMPDSWERSIRCEVVQEQPYQGARFLDLRFAADSRLASGLARNE